MLAFILPSSSSSANQADEAVNQKDIAFSRPHMRATKRYRNIVDSKSDQRCSRWHSIKPTPFQGPSHWPVGDTGDTRTGWSAWEWKPDCKRGEHFLHPWPPRLKSHCIIRCEVGGWDIFKYHMVVLGDSFVLGNIFVDIYARYFTIKHRLRIISHFCNYWQSQKTDF